MTIQTEGEFIELLGKCMKKQDQNGVHRKSAIS